MTPSIPRRIIQTARSRDLAPLARAAATNLRLLHPAWEYVFFDDAAIARFMAGELPHYRAAFNAFPTTIQRIDFFRYLAIHRLGGFYFDLDVFLYESIDELLTETCVFPFEELTLNRFLREECRVDWEIGNYAFGAAAGHPYLEAVIENCVRALREPDWTAPMLAGIPRWFRADYRVLTTTGPGLITRTLAEEGAAARDVTILFPADVCDEQNWHQFGKYGVHAMQGSWREKLPVMMRKLELAWEGRLRRGFLAESKQRGPTRRSQQPAFA
jgi:inositol phosphorylceramide mannosyltransferase catalytic subunit